MNGTLMEEANSDAFSQIDFYLVRIYSVRNQSVS